MADEKPQSNKQGFIEFSDGVRVSYSGIAEFEVRDGKLQRVKIDSQEPKEKNSELRVPSYETEESPVIASTLAGINSAPAGERSNPGIAEPVPSIPEGVASTLPRNDTLLSMVEAEKYCDYSAAYLSLRVRQGKLKGKKKGRNWYTTLDWINEYVAAHGAKESTDTQPAVAPIASNPVLVSKPEKQTMEVQKHGSMEKKETGSHTTKLPSFHFPKFSLPKLTLPKLSLPRLPRPNFSFLQAKSFQRLTAGSLIALTLVLAFSHQSVRASFYDWSQAVAKTTVAIVSKTSKQVATAVVQTTKTASHAVAVTAQQSAAIVGQATAAVTTAIADNSVAVLEQVPQLTGQALASTSSLVSGFYRSSVALADSLQTDITSSLASVSLPDFSLPSVSLPHLALPDINLPSVSLPRLTFPDIPNPLPAIGQAYSRAQGTAFRFFGRLENKLAITGQSGQVLGESTRSSLAVVDTLTPPPTPSSKRRGLFDSILSPLSAAINFLNPSSPSSLIARLSGSVSEIGQTIRQADPLTKVSSSVTSFLSTINVAKVLQPAGSFLARLKSAPAATPDTTPYPLLTEEGTAPPPAPDTTVSGELSLQPAASLTPDQSVAVLPTNQPAPIRYTAPSSAKTTDGKPAFTLRSPQGEGGLSVTAPTPTGPVYFTITDPSTLQTAKTIHTLSNLIADATLTAKDLKVASVSSLNLTTPLLIASPTTIQDSLTVQKDLTVIGTLTASSFNPQSLTTGPIIAGSVSANSISASSLTATSAVSGKSISGTFGSFDQLSANSLAFGGGSSDTFLSKSPSTFQSSLTAQSTLSVTGAATLASTLAVTGASTLTGLLTANGGITLTGALSTSATSTAAAFVSTDSTATSTIAGNLAVTGKTTLTGTLTAVEAVSTLATTTLTQLSITSTIATSTLSTGGFTIGASQFVVQQTSGRVGIGTASPLSALHIQNTTSPQLTLAYDATNYLAFQTDSSGTTTLNAIGGLNASIIAVDPFRIATSSSVAFEVRDGLSNNQVFTINARAGSVAIGSSTPTALYALQVASTSPTQFLLGYDTTNNYYTTQISSQGQVTFVRHGLTVLAQGFSFQDTLNVATSTTETILTVNSTSTSHDTTTLAVYEQGLGRAFYIQRTNAAYATSSAAEIVTASSTALTLTSQSNSASSTLAVYQQGTNGPIVLFTDTNASTTPAFKIAAVTRDVEVREDYVQRSHSDLTALTNINDVYVYDTTKDSDGGKWRNNDKAQSTSWYNETLDNTAVSCTLDTDDRCGRKEFPEKAILVVTNSDLFIFDAKDNSQWMNFDEGSTASTTMSIIGGTSSTHASVTALNGTLYIANSASTYDGGVVAIDFNKDTAYFYGNSTNGQLKYNSSIANRNSTSLGYTTLSASLSLVDDNANDVWVQSIANKTFLAIATDTGVSLLNETDQTIVDFNINSSDDINNVILSPDGTLYYDTETAQTVNVFKNATSRGGDMVVAGTADMVYSATSQPAIFTSAQTINDLFLIPTSSFVDNKKGNTLFIGHNAGLTKLSENTASSTQSSVKYYGVASTTEEMVGDIRGMWPLNTSTDANPTDASRQANTMTGTNISSADYVTGVRGTGISFDGSTEYLSAADNDDWHSGAGNMTYGIWAYPTATPSAEAGLMVQHTGAGNGNPRLGVFQNIDKVLLYNSSESVSCTSNASLSLNQWSHVVVAKDIPNVRIYINGLLDQTCDMAGQFSWTNNSNSLYIGYTRTGGGAAGYFTGTLDEPFITTQALTPTQIKYMYEVGKKALESHTSGRITGVSGADSYQQLYGTTNIVKAILVDLENNLLYVGTNSSGDAGGVSVLGLGSDSLVDIYGSDANKNDDDYTQWLGTTDYDDIVSLSVSSRYPKTIVIASEAALWTETEQFSLDKYRSQTVNPHGETLTQTALTVNYNLDVGNSFAVYGKVLGASDSGNAAVRSLGEGRPTFRVASDGTVTVRDDILFTGRTTLTSLANINDIYVYDTTKDTDGGEWTCNDIARATSWYNEPLNTATRGKTRCFPRKAVIVATNSSSAGGGLYVYDAKDNSLWMRFDTVTGVTIDANMTIVGRPSSFNAYALNGKIYVGDNGAGNTRLRMITFKGDTSNILGTDGYWGFKGNISQRNSQLGHTSLITSYTLVNDIVNDISAAVVNGKTFVAVATDGGMSVINETDSTVANLYFDGTYKKVRQAFIAGTTLYGIGMDGSTYVYGDPIWSKKNIHNLTGNYTTTSFCDTAYAGAGESTTWCPNFLQVFSVAGNTASFGTLNTLYVTPGTSWIDPGSNTIYAGANDAVTVIAEKQNDETNGSVKKYTKDYISEEMVGDIRGMWPLEGNSNGLADASVQANTLTNNNSVTFNKTGIRGHAADFVAASSMSLSAADQADYTFTTAFSGGFWVKWVINGGEEGLVSKYDNNLSSDDTFIFYIGTNDKIAFNTITAGPAAVSSATPSTISLNTWYHIVGTYDGATQKLYQDGVLVDTDAQTGSMIDSAEKLSIGSFTGSDTALEFFDGQIDEVFLTAEVLTPAQIKRMYETGKRALEGGVEGVASSATSAHTAFRVGVAAGAVKYTAGQFIGSLIQVYDGPGSATSTRFITQTASSTADYYIQFSPDHSATIADNDTFSIGPNALQGDSNRITALAVDDTRDFIYIGSTSGTGTGGMVTKIALDSDTVTDVWHPSVGKADDSSQPYNTASTTAISLAGNTLAIGANDSSNGGLWSEYQQETLDHKLNGPKSVFTVIDRIQTPKITSITGLLTINTGVSVGTTTAGYASSTSLTIGTATTTINTLQIKAGPTQNLLLSGDSNVGLYVTNAGDVTIGGNLSAPTIYDVASESLTLAMNFNTETTNGTVVVDSSASQNNGTNSGATWSATGGFNNSGGYSFNGTTNSITTNAAPTVTGSKTISVWFTTSSVGNNGIFSFGSGSDYFLATTNSGKVLACANGATGNCKVSATVTANTWHHLVVTKTTGDISKVYLDGVDTTAAAGTFASQSSADNAIGRYQDSSLDWFWNGSIDNFRLYNRVLTDAEIKALYFQRNEVNDSFVRFAPSGNVGIGTTTPGFLLGVSGSSGGNWTGMSVTNTGAGSLYSLIQSTGASTAAAVKYLRTGVTVQDWLVGLGANTGGTGFEWMDVTGGQVEMTLSTAGNLSITGNCSDAGGGGGCTADYAEVYQKDLADNNLEKTDILALDSTTGKVTRADKSLGKTILLGVYSSAPGTLIGQRKNSIELGKGKGVMDNLDPDEIPVALVGRVPVKVNLEGGEIKIGDPIGLSSIPGTGMKIKSGQSIGVALQAYNKDSKSNTIEVFVRLSYLYDQSFVPIWDRKINEVVKEIGALRKEVGTFRAEVDARLKKLEKRK